MKAVEKIYLWLFLGLFIFGIFQFITSDTTICQFDDVYENNCEMIK